MKPENIYIGWLLAAVLLWTPSFVGAAEAVNLGSAANFTILAKSDVTAASGSYTIDGNVGLYPAAASFVTGFGLIADSSNQFATSSLVNGRVYAADFAAPTPAILNSAVGDMQTAYVDAAGRAPGATDLWAGAIGGQTFAPGVYKWSTTVSFSTDIYLTGGPNDVWIFQVAQDLVVGSGAQVVLAGGAQAKNIFWQVAGQATLGTTAVFNGNILCMTLIALNTNARLNGKALAQTEVTLQSNIVISDTGGYNGPNPPGAGQIFAFPSPARGGSINMAYEMRRPGEAEILVWNEKGDLAASRKDAKLAGAQRSTVDLADFAPGVYLYRGILTYEGGSVERLDLQKFVVIK